MAPGKGSWKGGKNSGKGGSHFALTNGNAWEGAADGAIREITTQLQSPGNEGHIWVHDWGRRYESSLGSLRGFLEAHPHMFVVTPGMGKKFTVALAGGGSKGRPWGARKGGKSGAGGKGGPAKGGGGWGNDGGWGSKGGWGIKGSWTMSKGSGKPWGGAHMALPDADASPDAKAEAAIREIADQLQEPGNVGNVWIRQWGPRYQSVLGPLRDFLESRPDKFTVLPGEGRKFTVLLEETGTPPATGKKRQGGKWVQQAPAAKRAKGQEATEVPKEETEEELTEAAIAEITKQLEKPGSTGHVWVRNWPRRFEKTLGPLKDFLDLHPEKFLVVPGEGKKFTVELMAT